MQAILAAGEDKVIRVLAGYRACALSAEQIFKRTLNSLLSRALKPACATGVNLKFEKRIHTKGIGSMPAPLAMQACLDGPITGKS